MLDHIVQPYKQAQHTWTLKNTNKNKIAVLKSENINCPPPKSCSPCVFTYFQNVSIQQQHLIQRKTLKTSTLTKTCYLFLWSRRRQWGSVDERVRRCVCRPYQAREEALNQLALGQLQRQPYGLSNKGFSQRLHAAPFSLQTTTRNNLPISHQANRTIVWLIFNKNTRTINLKCSLGTL